MTTDDRGLHFDQPHPARMYDYYLGGKDNYVADRKAVADVLRVFPTMRTAARTNRAFMHRATRFLARQGVRQFLDIGTGIPTEPNLHQIAQAIAPDSRVVYVDLDSVVLAHARALMGGTPEGRTAYIQADVADPQAILSAPALLETLDLSKPVAVSLFAVMHFIVDAQNPYDIVDSYINAMPPGSYLAMSHSTPDFDRVRADKVVEVYQHNNLPLQLRSREEFSHFFDGLELVEPGIVAVHRWHPDAPDTRIPTLPRQTDDVDVLAEMDRAVSFYAGIARK